MWWCWLYSSRWSLDRTQRLEPRTIWSWSGLYCHLAGGNVLFRGKWCPGCWWQPENSGKRNLNQLRLVNSPVFTGVLCVPGGAGFLPSTVWRDVSGQISSRPKRRPIYPQMGVFFKGKSVNISRKSRLVNYSDLTRCLLSKMILLFLDLLLEGTFTHSQHAGSRYITHPLFLNWIERTFTAFR